MYLRFTYDNLNRIKVEQFRHLSDRGNICVGISSITSVSSDVSDQQLRYFSNIKKRLRLKEPKTKANENKSKKFKPMSESYQPNVEHTSYGGQFQISDLDENNSEQWQNYFGGSGSGSNSPVERPPIPYNFRVWEPADGQDSSGGDCFKFRIVSYNVLAQILLECHPYLYTQCSPNNLKWKVRGPRLYEEITNLAPDILCLQEVQTTHLDTFYSKFEKLGYMGIFKQKTGNRHDGCAIYFKKSMFTLEDIVHVEFYQPELPILNRDNIGIIVKLTPKTVPSSPIVVATTHLLYNPRRTDVRLAQMQVFLAEIDRFAYYSNGRESGFLPIILTGDLNSTPDSAVIKLLDTGNVSASPLRGISDWKQIGVTDNCQHLSVYLNRIKGKTTDFEQTKIHNSEYRQNLPDTRDENKKEPSSEHNELFNSDSVGHLFDLRSVYPKVKPDGYCEATTFQDFWVMADYIYFSRCSSLKLTERLRLPTTLECSVLGTLPNDVYGSDHLALAATFELRTPKSSL